MADTYEIQYQGKAVGAVRTEKQGLYHCFHCRCSLPDDGMYRIHAIAGDRREDLGICIPVEGKFGMDKKIPLKRLGDGEVAFQLVPKDWEPEKTVMAREPEQAVQEESVAVLEQERVIPSEPVIAPEPILPEEAVQAETVSSIAEPAEQVFVPVSEEEPFEQLDMLENAVMEVRDGRPGIVIKE